MLWGETPLPEYIKRKAEPEDAERYQCIYAEKEGAVMALLPPVCISVVNFSSVLK